MDRLVLPNDTFLKRGVIGRKKKRITKMNEKKRKVDEINGKDLQFYSMKGGGKVWMSDREKQVKVCVGCEQRVRTALGLVLFSSHGTVIMFTSAFLRHLTISVHGRKQFTSWCRPSRHGYIVMYVV